MPLFTTQIDLSSFGQTPGAGAHWLRVLLFGRPLTRQRSFDESLSAYRLAQFAHFYRQRGGALLALCSVLAALTLAHIVHGVHSGTAGIRLGAPPPSPYAAATTAARRALPVGVEFSVYALPCDSGGGLAPLGTALPLDAEQAELNPRSLDGEDIAAFERLARQLADRMPCVCGPLVGFARRLAAVGVAVLVNPVRVGQTTEPTQSVVRHTLTAHFNASESARPMLDGTLDVLVVRPDALVVESVGERAALRATTAFTGAAAYCVDECLDLLDGVTIWHRAKRQSRAGIDVNARWQSAIDALLECE